MTTCARRTPETAGARRDRVGAPAGASKMMDRMKRTSCVLALALFAGACSSPSLQSRAAPVPAERDLLYVCNQNDATVSVVDMATNTVVRTVDLQALGFSA